MAKRKLLLINKFYHDVGPAGGVGRYLVQEEEDLTAAGWEVIPFAMADEHARSSPWDRFFVKARDYSAPRWGGEAWQDALNLVWNREAARKLDALIRETRPDVAHLHNIYHHLSPSILPVLARHGIPAVMTLHDLRLLCPAIHMLRDDKVCEACRGGRFHNAVLGRCVKDSRAASLLAAVETFHQRTRRLYEDGVKVFLCPSAFYKEKFAQWGYPAGKLVHLPNFVDLDFWHPDNIPSGAEKDAFIYFGRISREKGLRTVLDAQALWEQGHRKGLLPPPLRFLVAGEGPVARGWCDVRGTGAADCLAGPLRAMLLRAFGVVSFPGGGSLRATVSVDDRAAGPGDATSQKRRRGFPAARSTRSERTVAPSMRTSRVRRPGLTMAVRGVSPSSMPSTMTSAPGLVLRTVSRAALVDDSMWSLSSWDQRSLVTREPNGALWALHVS